MVILMTAKECRKRYYENNKERILAQKRENYKVNAASICKKYRDDKVPCELCSGILFRRSYLHKHLEIRHGIVNTCKLINL